MWHYFKQELLCKRQYSYKQVADRLGGLVVVAPARRAGDPGSIPGPGESFSLKLLILINLLKRVKRLQHI